MFRIVFMAESGDGELETDEETAADDEKSAADAAPFPRYEIDEHSACSHRPAAARRPTRASIEFMMELPRSRGVTKHASDRKEWFPACLRTRFRNYAGDWTRYETGGRRKIGGIL